MIFQPCVALSDGAVMHVVFQIRDDAANDGQLSEIVREAQEVFSTPLPSGKDSHGLCFRTARVEPLGADVFVPELSTYPVNVKVGTRY